MKHMTQYSQSRPSLKTLQDYSSVLRVYTHLFVFTTLFAIGCWGYGEIHLARAVEPVSPSVEVAGVMAMQSAPAPQSSKQEILHYIVDTFGDDADKMITIIGTCENGTWDQSRINHNSNGSTDYGIAQVNDLNGARDKQCAGLDYRNNWKDNLDCAYKIYRTQGLQAWACSHRVGITPFYER